MKKRIGFVLIFILFMMIGLPVVSAVTTDTKAPTVSKLSFVNGSTVKPGDKVYLNTDIKDDVSGVATVYLWTSRKTVNNDSYYGNAEDVGQALKVEYDENNSPYVMIPSTYIGGSYYIREVELWDKEDNRSWYYTADQMKYFHEMYDYLSSGQASVTLLDDNFDDWLDGMTGGFEPARSSISVKFTVEAPETDDEAPYVAAFDMKDQKVNYGDTYYFTLKVDDDSDREIYISVGLSNGVSMHQYFDVSKGSIATFEYTPYVHKTMGKISVEYVILEDIYGNTGFYLVDGYKGSLAVDYYKKICKTCESLRKDLYFEVIDDGTQDDEKPVLKDVKINKTEFPIPSFAKLELTATDNKKLANEAYVTFRSDNKELTATLYLQEDNVYRGELEISQYAEVGDYKLTDVSIGDAAGNGVLYCNYNQKYKDEDLDISLGFKLTSKFTPDVTTSTTDKEILQKIHDANDDAVIAIDATGNPVVQKYIFEEIKGTNKTIHIESNGIEWIFNGKDIENVKDINTSIAVWYDYNYDNLESGYLEKALILSFAENGQLPGMATVRIKLDYKLREYIGEEVYVYYYDKDDDKMFTDILGDSIVLNDNGWFEFKISHNSDYILTNKKPDTKYIKEDKELIEANEEFVANKEKKSNKKLIIIVCAIVAVLVVLGIVLVILRKRNKK